MSLKHDLKNIVVNEEVSGPFISLFLPLYPSKDNFKFDDTEFNSLLSKAKNSLSQNMAKRTGQSMKRKLKQRKTILSLIMLNQSHLRSSLAMKQLTTTTFHGKLISKFG